MQLLPKDSSKVLQREMAKDAASSCAALLESKPPRMKHMFEGAPTSHCGTKQEQQMDQLMARLTVVQQQLMSVWVPGQQMRESSVRRSPLGRWTYNSLMRVVCA